MAPIALTPNKFETIKNKKVNTYRYRKGRCRSYCMGEAVELASGRTRDRLATVARGAIDADGGRRCKGRLHCDILPQRQDLASSYNRSVGWRSVSSKPGALERDTASANGGCRGYGTARYETVCPRRNCPLGLGGIERGPDCGVAKPVS